MIVVMLYFYRIDSKSYGSDITSEGTDTPQRRQSATHPTGANPLINYPYQCTVVLFYCALFFFSLLRKKRREEGVMMQNYTRQITDERH